MYIDIHSHAYWKPAPFVTKFFTPEELIAAQDKAGIEKGVLLPLNGRRQAGIRRHSARWRICVPTADDMRIQPQKQHIKE